MLYSKKVVLSLGIAASLSGVAQADLLGGSVGGFRRIESRLHCLLLGLRRLRRLRRLALTRISH